MPIAKEKDNADFKVEIGAVESRTWTDTDIAKLKAQARELASKRSLEQRIQNEMAAIRYEMEEYIANSDHPSRKITLEKVVNQYLDILDLSFRKFAMSLDTTDGNLKKYLSGERRFNTELALKFGHFFHTEPELWLQVQLKNELFELKTEKRQMKRYRKYDYKKIVTL